MEPRQYSSIGEYDKTNNLIRYLEFTDDYQYVKCSYKVCGNTLERTYLQDYRADREPYTEQLNSIVEYSDNVMLFSMRLDGETYLQPILSGQSFTSLNTPPIVNTMFSCQQEQENSASVESFNLKSDLISDYLNKL
jgi:hypothetical protein